MLFARTIGDISLVGWFTPFLSSGIASVLCAFLSKKISLLILEEIVIKPLGILINHPFIFLTDCLFFYILSLARIFPFYYPFLANNEQQRDRHNIQCNVHGN